MEQDLADSFEDSVPEPEFKQVLITWCALIAGGVALYFWFERRQSASGTSPTSGHSSPVVRREFLDKAASDRTPASTTAAQKPNVLSEGGTSRGWAFNKSKAREESLQAGRQAALDRLQAAHEAATREAQDMARVKAEEARVEAERKKMEQAAEREAAGKLAREEASKNVALMEEMKRRKEEQKRRQEADAAEMARRKEEALVRAREERAAAFQGDIKVYAKLADGDADKRVLLEGISAASSVLQVKEAVQRHTNVHISDQTLVVNGNVLRNDVACLVDFLKTAVSEICVILMRRPGSTRTVQPPTMDDVEGLDLYD
ncbi:hypothetical protein CYMTET_44933 [Cymbomonas tetramitiformis]|uniref:Ubiquitin-like domain-containing protein n=1 Tax=Cymbomonas tetramitiformis TaxID=36881 RepID=A0AAE0EYT9_9CHLO|nr:hypothetical protein CYMTET_44933 [Cymbomonas tetramitiformis]